MKNSTESYKFELWIHQKSLSSVTFSIDTLAFLFASLLSFLFPYIEETIWSILTKKSLQKLYSPYLFKENFIWRQFSTSLRDVADSVWGEGEGKGEGMVAPLEPFPHYLWIMPTHIVLTKSTQSVQRSIIQSSRQWLMN